MARKRSSVDAAGAKPPERIGRYRIESELGRGGMAVVYRAVLEGPGGFAKVVCLKRILPASAKDPLMVEMFEREARIAATLQHANVVQLYDFDLYEGLPFLVMELVDGPSLWEIFSAAAAAKRPIPIDVACGIAVQILAGLHHVHTRTRDDGQPLGLVHRDVSLHNVLVSRAGEVKVADFGIARATQLGERTRTGVLKGKLAYIAPEYVATGRSDARADLFSVGVILHELLSGRRRTPPATEAEGLGWVLHPQIQPIQELRPDVPDALAAAIRSLVSRLPGDRPDDAAQAAALLAAAQRPASAAEIARWLETLIPVRRSVPAEPTRRGFVEDPSNIWPTPSPWEPTMTRWPTGADRMLPGVRGEFTPDASTAIPVPPRRTPWRRWGVWGVAGLGTVAAIGLTAWLARGADERDVPSPGARAGSEIPTVVQVAADPRSSAAAPLTPPPLDVSGPASLMRTGATSAESTATATDRSEPVAPSTHTAPEDTTPPAEPAYVSPEHARPGAGTDTRIAKRPDSDGVLSHASSLLPGPPGMVSPEDQGATASARPPIAEPRTPDAAPLQASRPGPAASTPSARATRPSRSAARASASRSAEAERRRATERAEQPVSQEPGRLEVFALPWAYVSIDGSGRAETPVRGREVPSGRRLIVLDNPDMPCRVERWVDVPAGGNAEVRVNLYHYCPRPPRSAD